MTKCPGCGEETLEDFDGKKICSNCKYKIFEKEYFEQETKKEYEKNRFGIYILKILFIIPIIFLFILMISIGVLSVKEVFSYNNSTIIINESPLSRNIADKLLVYFFIMLALIDFSSLILQEYVRPLLFPFDDGSSTTQNIKNLKKKIYLEKLMAFSVIIILLDIFSKIFSKENNEEIESIIIGVSIVLISIGIWKYLSLKAESK